MCYKISDYKRDLQLETELARINNKFYDLANQSFSYNFNSDKEGKPCN